jgi:hypothetical protein
MSTYFSQLEVIIFRMDRLLEQVVQMNERAAHASTPNEHIVSLMEENLKVLKAVQESQPGQTPKRGKYAPKTFSGEEKDPDLTGFIKHFHSIFDLDPVSFPTDPVKVEFLGTCLEGKAREWYENFQLAAAVARLYPDNAKPHQLEAFSAVSNWDVFLTKFKAVFDALLQLRALKQTGSYLSYVGRFDDLAGEILENYMLGISEGDLMEYFRNGLSDDTEGGLTRDHCKRTSIEDLGVFATQIVERLRERGQHRPQARASDSGTLVLASSTETSSLQTPSCSHSRSLSSQVTNE